MDRSPISVMKIIMPHSESVGTSNETGRIVIVIVYACNPVQPLASVAVTVKVNVPAVVGVPEIMPLLVSDIPGASSPAVMLKVYGTCPPLAVMLLL